MTRQDIHKLFKGGHPLWQSFTLKGREYGIGERRLTEAQFNECRKHFEEKCRFTSQMTPLMKHTYTYNP